MSSTLIKQIPKTTLYGTPEHGPGKLSLPKYQKRHRGVELSPPLSMLDKLERIQERHLSDPPDTGGLKPYQISTGGKNNCMLNTATSVSSVLRTNQLKSANSNTGNHLPLAEFMSF